MFKKYMKSINSILYSGLASLARDVTCSKLKTSFEISFYFNNISLETAKLSRKLMVASNKFCVPSDRLTFLL